MALFIIGLTIALSAFWLLTRRLPMYRLAGLLFLCTAALCGYLLYRSILNSAPLWMLALLCACGLTAPIGAFLLTRWIWRLCAGGDSASEAAQANAPNANAKDKTPARGLPERFKAAWSTGFGKLKAAFSRQDTRTSKPAKAQQTTPAASKAGSGKRAAAGSVAYSASVPVLTAERNTSGNSGASSNLQRQRLLAAAEAARRAAQAQNGKRDAQSAAGMSKPGSTGRIAVPSRQRAEAERQKQGNSSPARPAARIAPAYGAKDGRPKIAPYADEEILAASIKAFDPEGEPSGESVRLLTPEEASKRLAAMPRAISRVQEKPSGETGLHADVSPAMAKLDSIDTAASAAPAAQDLPAQAPMPKSEADKAAMPQTEDGPSQAAVSGTQEVSAAAAMPDSTKRPIPADEFNGDYAPAASAPAEGLHPDAASTAQAAQPGIPPASPQDSGQPPAAGAAQLQQALAELSTLRSEHENLQTEHAKALQELQIAREQAAEAARAKEAQAALALELEKLQTEHAKALQDLQAAQAKAEEADKAKQAQAALALELEKLQTEHAKALQDLQAAQAQAEEADKAKQAQAALTLELENLQTEHAKALQELQIAREQAAEAARAKEAQAALALALNQVRAERAKALQDLQAARAQAAEAAKAKEALSLELEKAQAEHARMVNALQAAQKESQDRAALAISDARALAQAFEEYKAGVEQARKAAEQRYQQNLAQAQAAREKAEAALAAALREAEQMRLAHKQELERALEQAEQKRLEEAARKNEQSVQAAPENHPAHTLLQKADQLRQRKAYALAIPLYEQCAAEAAGTPIAKTAILRKLDCCGAMGDNDALIACAQHILNSGRYALTDAERAKVRLVLNITLQRM